MDEDEQEEDGEHMDEDEQEGEDEQEDEDEHSIGQQLGLSGDGLTSNFACPFTMLHGVFKAISLPK